MAFNGSKHFNKQALIQFMESIGMRFGPDLNAMTSFDETIFMLTIPTESEETMTTAFQILEDWAHGLTLEDEEIERERGVIIEEWRLGRGAQGRMMISSSHSLPGITLCGAYAYRKKRSY